MSTREWVLTYLLTGFFLYWVSAKYKPGGEHTDWKMSLISILVWPIPLMVGFIAGIISGYKNK